MVDELTLELSGVVEGPPARVYAAMTDPEQVAAWWGPDGFTCPEVILDVRVGGAFRIAMQPPDGALFHLVGEYVDVDPPSRIAYTFRWIPPAPDDRETIASLRLDASGPDTVVRLTQGPFSTRERLELHRAGWSDTLARLTRHVASR